jgi:hypothetical protein
MNKLLVVIIIRKGREKVNEIKNRKIAAGAFACRQQRLESG